MGKIVELVLIFIWLPQAVGQFLEWLYWWQVKEYRLDRFIIFLKSESGKKELNLLVVIAKLSFLFLSLKFSQLIYIVYLLFIFSDLKYFSNLFKSEIRRPVLTNRTVNILLTGLIFALLIFIAEAKFSINLVLMLLLLELGLLLSLGAGIFWTSLLVKIFKRFEIEKAQNVMKKSKPVVIGVTGSYGKTATKDFITHLLSEKYKTIKTSGSENTELGIARKTTELVKKDTEYFVVEMGAYKREEIRALTKIVEPNVGVITGIEPQHLALFGSFANIKRAKFELIESLPQEGVAIFNLSNKYCRELYRKAKELPTNLKVFGYYLREKESKVKADLSVKIILENLESIEFEVEYQGIKKRLKAPISGAHFVENIAGAILVALNLGVNWNQITRGLKTISLPEKTMQVRKLKNGSYLIDDTFNSTPAGFEAALKYLNLFKDKKRVVITHGIIELGRESSKIHTILGKHLAKYSDLLILTSDEFIEDLKNGMDVASTRLKVEKDWQEIKNLLFEQKQKSAILLEGRIPAKIYKKITQYN